MFDYMIADMVCNNKFHPAVSELFIKSMKLNIYLVFINYLFDVLSTRCKAKFHAHFYHAELKKRTNSANCY